MLVAGSGCFLAHHDSARWRPNTAAPIAMNTANAVVAKMRGPARPASIANRATGSIRYRQHALLFAAPDRGARRRAEVGNRQRRQLLDRAVVALAQVIEQAAMRDREQRRAHGFDRRAPGRFEQVEERALDEVLDVVAELGA